MVDATIARARQRDLACLGRSRPAKTGAAGLRRSSASQSCQLAPRVGRSHGITPLAAEEPALERLQQLVALERPDLRGAPVLSRDAGVVAERPVGGLERVGQLVALEDVVLTPGLLARPVLRVDRPADRPQRTGQPLDPDQDPLRLTPVVDPVHHAFGEPGRRWLSHAQTIPPPLARIA